MADIGHSVLLKFFIDTPEMSEATTEIESNAPKNQELRGSPEHIAAEKHEEGDQYSPVIRVTKEETTLTKGELKVHKVVVSQDVSGESELMETTTTTSIVTGNDLDLEGSGSKVQISVNTEEAIFTSDEKGDKVKKESKQTRIPTLKFKQAVERIKREEKQTKEKLIQEQAVGGKVKSSVPRLKEAKQNLQKLQQNGEGKSDSIKLDDEFDKLYDEIKDNVTDVSIPTPESLRDAEMVDSIFEEIIHAYDENFEKKEEKGEKKLDIATEKIKSKIPLLKRKSEHDIQVPSNRRGSLKRSTSVDESKIPVQTKIVNKKDLESMKRNNSLKYGTSPTSKTRSFEHKSLTKTFKSQKSFETEHISCTKLATELSEDVSSNEIPVKSHLLSVTENKLNSAPINTKSVKADENVLNQKMNVEECKLLNVTSVKKECNISEETTKRKSIDENETIVQNNNKENLTTHQTETNINENEILTKTQSSNSVNEINIRENSTIVITSREMVETIQNIETEVSKGNVTKVTTHSKSDLKASENESSLNKETVINSSGLHENDVINKHKDRIELTEISRVNLDVKNEIISESTNVIRTVNENTLKYDSSIDLNSASSETAAVNQEEGLNTSDSKVAERDTTLLASEENQTISNITYKNNTSKENQQQRDINSVFVISQANQDTTDEGKYIDSESQSPETVLTISNVNDFNDKKETEERATVHNKIVFENLATGKYIATEINNYRSQENDPKFVYESSNSPMAIVREVNIENTTENRINLVANSKTKTEITATNNKQRTEVNNDNYAKVVQDQDIKNTNVYMKSTPISSQIKNIEDLEEEDIIILKGKVNRIISRLDSREVKIEKIENDIPKDISVASKIPIFENSVPETHKKEPESHKTHDNKPIIVDEILKPNQNEYRRDRSIFSDSSKNVNSLDYNSVYNRVHSSVLKRLKSFETNSNYSLYDDIYETDKKTINKEEINNTEIKRKEKEDKSQQKYSEQIEKKGGNGEVFQAKTFNRTKSLAEITSADYKMNTTKNVFDMKFKEFNEDRRAKSLAELDMGNVVQGRVRQMVMRMNSIEKENKERRAFERCRSRGTTLSRAALFEYKVVAVKREDNSIKSGDVAPASSISEEELKERIEELASAKLKYGTWENMPRIELRDGNTMPVLAVGTALLEPKLIKHIIAAAIDLGYRAFDTAFIYGLEKEIGEAIKSKIEDGTVKREDLFIISKLWSTFHRRDLVETACLRSLDKMGLKYFDLYIIHNPMSLREGSNPLPKIANVLQYSQHDYLEAWYGMEAVIARKLARSIGLSNFNSAQVDRIMDKAKIKPVINQVECHPYLTQHSLEDFCANRNIKLSCFGVLGSKGTPLEWKSGSTSVIDDPLVQVMAAGLGVTPAQLLIAYQLHHNRNVVVKSSTAAHLWNNLQAITVTLDQTQVCALDALNKNKRTFTFKGMGDTHKNYPFKITY